MRGGNDNLAVTIVYRDGSKLVFQNVNVSTTWIPLYCALIPLSLSRDVNSKADFKQIILEYLFGGSCNGDNWDIKNIAIMKNDEKNIIDC